MCDFLGVFFFFLMIDFLYRSNVDVVVKKEYEDSQVTSFFRSRCNFFFFFFWQLCEIWCCGSFYLVLFLVNCCLNYYFS